MRACVRACVCACVRVCSADFFFNCKLTKIYVRKEKRGCYLRLTHQYASFVALLSAVDLSRSVGLGVFELAPVELASVFSRLGLMPASSFFVERVHHNNHRTDYLRRRIS